MRYTSSAEFLKVLPPETSFGGAWEALCFDLVAADKGSHGLQRLNPPDRGIDIFHAASGTAFKCKSAERGAFGSLSGTDSITSLKAAAAVRLLIGWRRIAFATNANYTGTARTHILEAANALQVSAEDIDFLGPEHWDALCSKHFDRVRHRFDFRITVTEAQVVEAFRKARYYDEHVNRFAGSISKGSVVLIIKNNRTPVELEIPFSPELTVENCVDVVQELLGVSLKWTNFNDLGTSAGPSISLTVDRHGQSFKQTIGEVQTANPGTDLVFWIKLVWKDETQKDGVDHNVVRAYMNLALVTELSRSAFDEGHRREHTLRRSEEMIQAMIWNAARRLKHPDSTAGAV